MISAGETKFCPYVLSPDGSGRCFAPITDQDGNMGLVEVPLAALPDSAPSTPVPDAPAPDAGLQPLPPKAPETSWSTGIWNSVKKYAPIAAGVVHPALGLAATGASCFMNGPESPDSQNEGAKTALGADSPIPSAAAPLPEAPTAAPVPTGSFSATQQIASLTNESAEASFKPEPSNAITLDEVKITAEAPKVVKGKLVIYLLQAEDGTLTASRDFVAEQLKAHNIPDEHIGKLTDILVNHAMSKLGSEGSLTWEYDDFVQFVTKKVANPTYTVNAHEAETGDSAEDAKPASKPAHKSSKPHGKPKSEGIVVASNGAHYGRVETSPFD